MTTGNAQQDERNRLRWEKFSADEMYPKVKLLVNQIVTVAGLQVSDLGRMWGVTVHVDKETFIRVNCGDFALFDIRDPELPFEERTAIAVAVVPKDYRPALKVRSLLRLSGYSYDLGSGFPRKVAGSMSIQTEVAAFRIMLSDGTLAKGISDHVSARRRPLPQPSWHNPLSVALFD